MSQTDRATHVPYRIALVLAPVLMGAAMLTDLTPQTSSTEELLELVGEHPDRWLLAGTLFLLSGLAWAVAGIGLHRTLGGRSRSVGIGGIALAAGGAGLALVDAAGYYLPGLATSGVSLEDQVGVVEHVEGAAPLVAVEVIHVVGWALGLLLVSIGLLRSRVVSRSIPVSLLASLALMVAFSSGVPLMAAVAAQVGAFAALAVRLPRAVDRAPSPTRVAVSDGA